MHFSNFGSLKSTETRDARGHAAHPARHFSNFGSLKSTETQRRCRICDAASHFSNFGSLKSTETRERQHC